MPLTTIAFHEKRRVTIHTSLKGISDFVPIISVFIDRFQQYLVWEIHPLTVKNLRVLQKIVQ